MLRGIHVVVIGGDARQLEVIKKFSDLKATVTLVGFEDLNEEMPSVEKKPLDEETLRKADVVVLPVVGTDDQGYVESIFSSRPIRLLDQHLACLNQHAVIYTGMARDYLERLATKHSIKLVQLLGRNDVAIYNSIPTAEGALMMAIENTDITIHGSTCAVLGFGRTGMTMARTLKNLGARVKVGARREDHLARIYEMGFIPFHTNELRSCVHDIDLLFNTIPTRIVTREVLDSMPKSAVIIDLASSPGGTDFQYAEKMGIKALLAPGLPGIVAPKTAGKIMADTLSRLVLEQKGNQEE
ncbi:MAG: dipicolinate synthase subunit DpsA [Bacillaceae bacterium]|nr:dipicolinate synthase subunit DpsA [Bacillaceae bacterium]